MVKDAICVFVIFLVTMHSLVELVQAEFLGLPLFESIILKPGRQMHDVWDLTSFVSLGVALTDRQDVAWPFDSIVIVLSILLILEADYSKASPHILFYLQSK